MKFLYSICLLLVINSFSYSQDKAALTETTTYFFIRHAEKDKSDTSNRNPHLTDIGQTRALGWSKIFQNIDFDAVYSTQYHRTMETAKPTAQMNKLEIEYYDPRNLYSEEFANATKGKTVLVVGHSNTTPAFVNSVLGTKKYESIDESNNGNLYIISIINGKATDQVLTIN